MVKSPITSLIAPDGSYYVTVTDGGGNIGGTVTTGQATMANSLPVVIASNQTPVSVKTVSATGTASSVASSATSVTILAANANRIGTSVYNDSTQILYLLLSTGPASSTAHTVQMPGGSFFEVPFGYTGIITGLWATASGNARVMEFV